MLASVLDRCVETLGVCRSANLGQDFEEVHRRTSIAVASFQMWPDNYNTTDPQFAAQWIGNHTIAARAIGKPLILDEVQF